MWRTEYRCTLCHHPMSYHTKLHSNGRCPYCGGKGEHACTICDTYEKAYRWKWVSWFKWRKKYLGEV